MKLKLHALAAPIHTLGPYDRFGVWVQGCDRRCPGCITPQAQPKNGGSEMKVDALVSLILEQKTIEGLTISGGEPFLQAKALCEMIEKVREYAPLGVILYTGNEFEAIRSEPLTALCDAIIDGSYVQALDDGGSMRGSSNQRLILLTDRYEGLISFGSGERKTEWIVPYGGGLAEVGVPQKRQSEREQSALPRRIVRG